MPTKENTQLSDEHGVFMKEMTDSSLIFVTTPGDEYLVHNRFNNISYIGGEKKLKEDRMAFLDINIFFTSVFAVSLAFHFRVQF